MAETRQILSIYEIILEAEKASGNELTERARQLLVLPITEVLDANRYFNDWGQVRTSITDIVKSLEPDKEINVKSASNVFTSRSIIKAFSEKYCHIPPFCGPV